MTKDQSDRRSFMVRAGGMAIGALVLPGWPTRQRLSPGALEMPALPRVLEIRSRSLHGARGETLAPEAIEDLLLAAVPRFTGGGEAPLDALAALFPNDPPVGIFVDASSGSASTRTLTLLLQDALVRAGSAPSDVVVADGTDDALIGGGYAIRRSGGGPRCHGSEPEPGYTGPMVVPGTGRSVRVSRLFLAQGRRAAVVGRLATGGAGTMAPFVLDAALRAFDPETRRAVEADPRFGAKLIASEEIAARIGIVIGDHLDGGLPDGRADSGAGAAARAANRRAGLLVGDCLLAVEAVGHRILSNACAAIGVQAPEPHPILSAAGRENLQGTRIGRIDWRKALL